MAMMVKQTTLRLDHPVPAGAMVMDQYGHVVGSVVGLAKVVEGTTISWEVTAEVEAGTDTNSLQVLPRSGITGSINNA